MSLTLGKYCTGTDGVVELRNLSRFPARQPASRPPLEARRLRGPSRRRRGRLLPGGPGREHHSGGGRGALALEPLQLLLLLLAAHVGRAVEAVDPDAAARGGDAGRAGHGGGGSGDGAARV